MRSPRQMRVKARERKDNDLPLPCFSHDEVVEERLLVNDKSGGRRESRGCLQIRLLSDSFVKRPFLLRSSTVRVHSLRKRGRFPRSRLKIRYLETAPRGNNFQAQPGQCRRCLSVSRSNTLSKPFFTPVEYHRKYTPSAKNRLFLVFASRSTFYGQAPGSALGNSPSSPEYGVKTPGAPTAGFVARGANSIAMPPHYD